MKQEFVTLYGKASIERGVLYLRSSYLPFEKTAFAQIGIELCWIALFVLRLFSSDSPMETFITIVCGLLLLSRFPAMYDKFIKKSFANRIRLDRIKDVTWNEDAQNIHVQVVLHLANGRYKKISFRKLENQFAPFIAALSSAYSAVELA